MIACMDQVSGAGQHLRYGRREPCWTATAGRPAIPDAQQPATATSSAPTPRDFQTNYLPPPQGGNPEAGQTATGNGTSGTAPIDQFRRGVGHAPLLFRRTGTTTSSSTRASTRRPATSSRPISAAWDWAATASWPTSQDGSGTNNANFATPPDGIVGPHADVPFHRSRRRSRRRARCRRSSMHELTHGISNRLIGNGAGLNWDAGGGMGEGWSDFVRLVAAQQHQRATTRTAIRQPAHTRHTSWRILAGHLPTTTSTASAASPTARTTPSTR